MNSHRHPAQLSPDLSVMPQEDSRHRGPVPVPQSQAMATQRSSNNTTPTQRSLEISVIIAWEMKTARAKFELNSSGKDFRERFDQGLRKVKFPYSPLKAEYLAEFIAGGDTSHTADLGELESEWPFILQFIRKNRAPEKLPEFEVNIYKG